MNDIIKNKNRVLKYELPVKPHEKAKERKNCLQSDRLQAIVIVQRSTVQA